MPFIKLWQRTYLEHRNLRQIPHLEGKPVWGTVLISYCYFNKLPQM